MIYLNFYKKNNYTLVVAIIITACALIACSNKKVSAAPTPQQVSKWLANELSSQSRGRLELKNFTANIVYKESQNQNLKVGYFEVSSSFEIVAKKTCWIWKKYGLDAKQPVFTTWDEPPKPDLADKLAEGEIIKLTFNIYCMPTSDGFAFFWGPKAW